MKNTTTSLLLSKIFFTYDFLRENTKQFSFILIAFLLHHKVTALCSNTKSNIISGSNNNVSYAKYYFMTRKLPILFK